MDTVIVTGCAGAIGSATCEVLKKSGFRVIGTDRDESGITVCDDFYCADLANIVNDEQENRKFSDFLVEANVEGNLHGLVNNAAVQIIGGIEEINLEQMRHSFDVNLYACFLLTQMCLPYMKKKGGSIVNVGSIHSSLTKKGFLAYSVSKHALDGLTRSLALELGPFNIRVNLIMPAATDTHMLREGFNKKGIDMAALEMCHPLERIAQPVEIANSIKFLISNDSSFVTGANLRVDGAIGVRLFDPE